MKRTIQIFLFFVFLILSCENKGQNSGHNSQTNENDTIVQSVFIYEEIFESDINYTVIRADTLYEQVGPSELLKSLYTKKHPYDSITFSKTQDLTLNFIGFLNDSIRISLLPIHEHESYFVFEEKSIGTIAIVEDLHFIHHGFYLTKCSSVKEEVLKNYYTDIKSYHDSIIASREKELEDLIINIEEDSLSKID